jgi:phosphomannomutase
MIMRPAGPVSGDECLLATEMVATRGKNIGVQLRELFAKVGSFYPVRENFRLTPEAMAAFTEKLKADPKEPKRAQGRNIVRTDDLKLIFEDGSWVCYRLSATEPVVRAYGEALNEKDMESLSAAAEKFVLS